MEIRVLISAAMNDIRENPRPNQLLLSIDDELWLMAELRTQEILGTVQPNVVSEVKRRQVIDYVQRLIGGFYGSEVFPFGSVPLKTYLPDGDIDLTVLSHDNEEEDMAQLVCNVLEMNDEPEYPVKDIQLIRAQVKVVKCTVKNIAVDISFNQMGGLFALRFLEQVNEILGKNHLFKHSILLVKAWCYYESRILGAHHGLLSTYAVEILVLYIINRYHASVRGPLEVLYRFLDYYSKFDWSHNYVSIEGPIALSSLPEIVEIPDSDRGELLLDKEFLKTYREMHAAYSKANDAANPIFTTKHLNILDPLKHSNNLGRSVNKGNLHRIKFALSFGARKLKDIFRLPGQRMGAALERFFMNTLNRNGKGQRPDIDFPVPAFGTGRFVEPVFYGDSDSFYGAIRYVQMGRNYGAPPPPLPGSPTSPSQADTLAQQAHQNWSMLYQRGTNVYVPKQAHCPPNSNTSHAPYSLEEAGKSRGTGPYIPDVANNFYWEMRGRLMRPSRFAPDYVPANAPDSVPDNVPDNACDNAPDNVGPPKSPEGKQLVEVHAGADLNVNSRSFELVKEDFPDLTSGIQNTGSAAADKSAQLIWNTGSSAADDNIQNTDSAAADESAQLIWNTGSSAADDNIQNTGSAAADESAQFIRNTGSSAANDIQNIGSAAADESAQLIQNTDSSAADESAQLIQNTGSTAAEESAQLTERDKISKSLSSPALNIEFGTFRMSQSLAALSLATKGEKGESGVSSSPGPVLVIEGPSMKGKEKFPESSEKMG